MQFVTQIISTCAGLVRATVAKTKYIPNAEVMHSVRSSIALTTRERGLKFWAEMKVLAYTRLFQPLIGIYEYMYNT